MPTIQNRAARMVCKKTRRMPGLGSRNTVLSEHQEQVLTVNWFRVKFKDVRIFAIPNGGNRNLVTGLKLKAEGVSPGVPDLYIPEWHVWVEMKKKKGKISNVQKDWHEYLKKINHTVLVCYGFSDAQQQITEWIK